MRVLWWCGFVVGCAGETPPPQLVTFEVSPGSAPAGADVTSTVEVADFELTGHANDGHDGHTHGAAGGVKRGHVHIYLDDLMSNPVLQQQAAVETFQVPADVEVGMHTLIARLHDASHLIIEPQVIVEQTFEVTE